ncbi:putative low-temperature viability protein ltv1 [Rosellinia necatrix]|uniref:Putative low-temperature viability protein ltv1 n=1 Tax=Rosellinia necatrix TaxID=77044 RepID=A0A1S7UL78_ROSNE|nr:putative low-temperature viability protein ltv1 [Rosellinia necatrix]
MPKSKWIDKKTAQHFTLVHRPQNDPLIHDTEAPSMVLNPTQNLNAAKGKKLNDLASELSSDDVAYMRANEGEAANYGVYYDDTEYDYMQHLRDLGSGTGDAVFVEAKPERNKGKHNQSLEDAIRQLDLEDEERKKRELFDDSFLPSKNLSHVTYQAQQNVPDAIAGLQPDMDPRLREVLEALEDDAYVDDEDDDIFQELAKDGRELDEIQFEEEFDDEGWETDDTAKPKREYNDGDEVPDLVPVDGAGGDEGEEADVVKNENWLEDFQKFKKGQKTGGRPAAKATPSVSDMQSSIMTTTTNGGRRKKRKGAQTSESGYSMTSSSLVRTEQLGLLDSRFEILERKKYNPDNDGYGFDGDIDDDDAKSTAMSTMSMASSVTGAMPEDFDNILDEFLGEYSMVGKKTVKKGKWGNGVEQFDELRRELGPARVPAKYGIKQRPTTTAKAGGASSSSSR